MTKSTCATFFVLQEKLEHSCGCRRCVRECSTVVAQATGALLDVMPTYRWMNNDPGKPRYIQDITGLITCPTKLSFRLATAGCGWPTSIISFQIWQERRGLVNQLWLWMKNTSYVNGKDKLCESIRWAVSSVVGHWHGDHLSGKPGNVREFDSCQGNVRDFTKSQGSVREKILSGTICLKLFIVSSIFASTQVFSRSLFRVKY